MDAGNADPGNLSFSTNAAYKKKVPQEFDIFSEAFGSEEYMTNLDLELFFPLILKIGRNFPLFSFPAFFLTKIPR